MAKLDGSYEDVVILILDVLRNNSPKYLFLKDLRSLSLTCRSLRMICLPVLFRTFKQVWGMGMFKQMIPRSLRSYVRIFELNLSAVDLYSLDGIGPPEDLTDGLSEVLSQAYMPFLHTFKLTNALFFGAWSTLLHTIFTLQPNIHTLEICDSVWRVPTETFSKADLKFQSQIRTFIYRAPFADCFPLGSKSYGRRDIIQGAVEVSNLVVLIESFRSTLEVLELPAELASRVIYEVANNNNNNNNGTPLFPKLREFCVQGHIPMSSNSLQCWQGFFDSDDDVVWAPLIRNLKLHLASDNASNRSIFPLEMYHNLLQFQSTELLSFTMSTPVSNDLVYQFLPESLVELDLRAYPIPGMFGASVKCVRTTVPSALELSTIFQVMHLPRLETLKISYTVGPDDGEETLLAHLTRAFSILSLLEIHRYRSLASQDPTPRHLASSTHLKVLLLNLDLPEHPILHRTLWNDPSLAEQHHTERKTLEIGTSKTFAESIKCLSTIGIMSHEGFSSHWNIWEIIRRQSSHSEPIVELLNRGKTEV